MTGIPELDGLDERFAVDASTGIDCDPIELLWVLFGSQCKVVNLSTSLSRADVTQLGKSQGLDAEL